MPTTPVRPEEGKVVELGRSADPVARRVEELVVKENDTPGGVPAGVASGFTQTQIPSKALEGITSGKPEVETFASDRLSTAVEDSAVDAMLTVEPPVVSPLPPPEDSTPPLFRTLSSFNLSSTIPPPLQVDCRFVDPQGTAQLVHGILLGAMSGRADPVGDLARIESEITLDEIVQVLAASDAGDMKDVRAVIKIVDRRVSKAASTPPAKVEKGSLPQWLDGLGLDPALLEASDPGVGDDEVLESGPGNTLDYVDAFPRSGITSELLTTQERSRQDYLRYLAGAGYRETSGRSLTEIGYGGVFITNDFSPTKLVLFSYLQKNVPYDSVAQLVGLNDRLNGTITDVSPRRTEIVFVVDQGEKEASRESLLQGYRNILAADPSDVATLKMVSPKLLITAADGSMVDKEDIEWPTRVELGAVLTSDVPPEQRDALLEKRLLQLLEVSGLKRGLRILANAKDEIIRHWNFMPPGRVYAGDPFGSIPPEKRNREAPLLDIIVGFLTLIEANAFRTKEGKIIIDYARSVLSGNSAFTTSFFGIVSELLRGRIEVEDFFNVIRSRNNLIATYGGALAGVDVLKILYNIVTTKDAGAVGPILELAYALYSVKQGNTLASVPENSRIGGCDFLVTDGSGQQELVEVTAFARGRNIRVETLIIQRGEEAADRINASLVMGEHVSAKTRIVFIVPREYIMTLGNMGIVEESVSGLRDNIMGVHPVEEITLMAYKPDYTLYTVKTWTLQP